jgi:hypothetical protein
VTAPGNKQLPRIRLQNQSGYRYGYLGMTLFTLGPDATRAIRVQAIGLWSRTAQAKSLCRIAARAAGKRC